MPRPLLWPLALLAACAPADENPGADCPGGKCDSAADSCELDGRTGDGQCDLDCNVPDIDCFHLFSSHDEAEVWFADFEAQLAAEEGRAPRTTVAPGDPRFERMRRLLDTGWEAYVASAPVGRLDRAPELIVIDDELSNAWATIDLESQRSAWVVMVHTALLDGTHDDAAMTGLVMHELEHAAQLHLVPGVKERLTRYYQVLPGEPEPFGFQTESQPAAAEAVTEWLALGKEAGAYPLEAMNGMPGPGSDMLTVLDQAHQAGVGNDAERCAAATARRDELFAFLGEKSSRFDFQLHLGPGDDEVLAQLSAAYLEELQGGCLAGASFDLIDLIAAIAGAPRETIEAQLAAEDRALIDGKPVVEQIRALVASRYQTMRGIDAALREDSGAGLESARYYSYEEAADDRAVNVLAEAGLDPAGNGTFLHAVVEREAPAEAAACADTIARGDMPDYGNLIDPHHSACWRIWHTQKLADYVAGGQSLPRVLAPATTVRPAPSGVSALLPVKEVRTTDDLHRIGRLPTGGATPEAR